MTNQEALKRFQRKCKGCPVGYDGINCGECINKNAIEALQFQYNYQELVDVVTDYVQSLELDNGEPLKQYKVLTNDDYKKYKDTMETMEKLEAGKMLLIPENVWDSVQADKLGIYEGHVQRCIEKIEALGDKDVYAKYYGYLIQKGKVLEIIKEEMGVRE